MQKKRLWAVAGTVFAILLLALLVIPSFIDWSKYQSVARDKVRTATGYDLTINGKLSMSLLPTPHATVTDVVVNKPLENVNQPFLKLEKADVRVALLPLLVGKIQIASITLEKPVVKLIKFSETRNNFTPVKNAPTPAANAAPGEAHDGGEQSISIDEFKIRNGQVVYNDIPNGKSHQIGIEELRIKANTLTGPFDGDGKISYGDAHFRIDLNTGGYKENESLPVQLNIEEKQGRAKFKWSGVMATGAAREYQGELAVGFTDLAGVLEDAGQDIAVPNIGKTELSGMLTLNDQKILLTNGNLQLGKTKFKARLDIADYKTQAMAINATFDSNDFLDIDELMKVANSRKKETGKNARKEPEKSTAPAAKTKPLLPADFELPKGLTTAIQLTAPGIDYRSKKTGPLSVRINAADGLGNANLNIEKLPGGGGFATSAEMREKGVIEGTIMTDIASLKDTLAKWLGVVDEKTLDQPGMPRRVDLQSAFKISGYNATATIGTLSLGETKLNGTVSYTAAARPVVNATLTGNVFTLPSGKLAKNTDEKAGGKKEETAPAAKGDFKFEPPVLPFDVKFDLTMGRLVKDDLTLTNVMAAGIYNSKGITLGKGQATVNGGTLNATGSVADLKAMSGIDVQASLRTLDLESFVAAMTGKPLELKQKIGEFTGSLKAKGDRKALAADITAAARGYTIAASGTLDDPFSPDLPGTMNVRIRHANLTDAIRVFSPAFNNSGPQGAAQPVDLSGVAKINGKVYQFDSLKGVLGTSDIAGAVKADLSGSVPSITANLSSTKMDLGSLLGVANKSSKVGGSATATTAPPPPSASGNWSREQLDLGLMKSMTLDIDIAARTLIYGTWTLTDAKAGIDLKGGVLKVSPLSGGLYGGTMEAGLNANVGGTPAVPALNIDGSADVKNVAIGPFLQALMSSSTKHADGTGSLKLTIKGNGGSAGQLMNSLNGEANVNAKTLTIYGMDIDKLAANIVEAFDGGWKGVLAGVTTQGLTGGQTRFKDVDQKFPIAGGDMAVKAFRMETTSGNATLNTNGTVSFGRFMMDVQTDVMVTQPKDVPVINLRISGPLNSPAKSVNSTALDNLIRGKVGDKVNDLVKDKLGDSPLGNALGQFLGGSQKPPAAAVVTPASPSATPAQMAPVTETPATPQSAPAEPAPAAEPQAVAPPVQEKSPEQQILEGILNRIGQ